MIHKYKNGGKSGAYSSEYHALLGVTPWIMVRRLLRHPLPMSSHDSDSGKRIGYGSPIDVDDPEKRCMQQYPRRVIGRTQHSELSEGDIATVFSQFGEVTDVRLVRHRKTGASLGTAFVCFEDYRSAIVAADCMNSDVEKPNFVRISIPATKRVSGADTATGDLQATEAALTFVPSKGGISVERCEVAEVPAVLNKNAETYAQWLQRTKEQSL